jgi:hypothetical protein
MAWPKGKSRREYNESAAVQKPELPEVGHEAAGGDLGAVHGGVPDLRDGSRPHPHRRKSRGPEEDDGAEAAGSGDAVEVEAGQEDVCLTDWHTVTLEEAEVQLGRLRIILEEAAQVVQGRITAKQSAECVYCGKVIADYSKAFARLSNRNPKTGLIETETVCTEQCYRGYRQRQVEGSSYATA